LAEELTRTHSAQPLPVAVLGLLGAIDLARGSFHWLVPDSGAGIVAGMDLHNAGAPNIVFLLAADGISQIAWGVLDLLVVFRERRFVPLMFAFEAARSAALLVTEYLFKPPVPPVPGRFMHMATFAVAVIMYGLARRCGFGPGQRE